MFGDRFTTRGTALWVALSITSLPVLTACGGNEAEEGPPTPQTQKTMGGGTVGQTSLNEDHEAEGSGVGVGIPAAPAGETRPANATSPDQLFDGVLSVRREIPDHVSVGAPITYDIVVQNASQRPVQNVVLHEMVSSGFQLRSAQPPWDQVDQPGSSLGSSSSMRGSRGSSSSPSQSGGASQGSAGRAQSSSSQSGSQPSTQQSEQSQQNEQSQPSGQDSQGQQSGESQGQQSGQQGQGASGGGPAGAIASETTYTWNLGALQPGNSKIVSVRAVTNQEGPLHLCTSAEAQPAICSTIQAVKPELMLTRSWSEQGDVYACQDLAVTYRVSNGGSGATQPVTVTEDLPHGLVTADGKQTVQVQLDPVQPGETAEKTVPLQVQQGGQFGGNAQAKAGQLDAQADSPRIHVLKPELALKVSGSQQVTVNQPATFDIVVKNPSNDPAIDTLVKIGVPGTVGDMTLSSNGRPLEHTDDGFSVGRLEGGESVHLQLQVTPSEPGDLQGNVVASAYCVAAKEQPIQAQVKGVAAYQLTVVDQKDPVAVGDQTVYEVKAWNEGSAKGENLQLTGTLPDTLTFVSAQGDSDVKGSGQSVQFTPVSLAPGEMASWLVTVKGANPGKGTFKVQLQAQGLPQGVIGMEPTTVVPE